MGLDLVDHVYKKDGRTRKVRWPVPLLWEKSKNLDIVIENDMNPFYRKTDSCFRTQLVKKKRVMEECMPRRHDYSHGYILCSNCQTVIVKIPSSKYASFINTDQFGNELPRVLQTLREELQEHSVFDELFKCDRYLKISSRKRECYSFFNNITFWWGGKENKRRYRMKVCPRSRDMTISRRYRLHLLFCVKCLGGPIGTFTHNFSRVYIAINDSTRISRDGW